MRASRVAPEFILPLARFGQFPDLAFDGLALQARQAVNKEFSVQVVNFVAEGAGQ